MDIMSIKKEDFNYNDNTELIKLAKDGDVIYIDPPYDYEDDDGFTKYQMTGFTFDDFVTLKKVCDKAINNGAFVIISNNATQKVLNLFAQDPKYKIFYDVSEFPTLRTINCNGSERRTGKEAIFWGMNNNVPFPQANNMKKIIKLLMVGDSILTDKEKTMEIIDVNTTRQVAYYFSALQFFKYLTHDKKFTDNALSIVGNETEIKNDIYKQLMNNELFEMSITNFKIGKMNFEKERVSSILNKLVTSLFVDTSNIFIKKFEQSIKL